MSTPAEKRIAASSLRWYADEIEPALDEIPGLSHMAWDCPAGDGFNAETASQRASLGSAAGTLRTVAGLLDAAASAQEAEEAAAAAGTAEGGSSDVPPTVW